jgi:hypothetical protein
MMSAQAKKCIAKKITCPIIRLTTHETMVFGAAGQIKIASKCTYFWKLDWEERGDLKIKNLQMTKNKKIIVNYIL